MPKITSKSKPENFPQETRGEVNWVPLYISPEELRLDVTLVNGQSFAWTLLPPSFATSFPMTEMKSVSQSLLPASQQQTPHTQQTQQIQPFEDYFSVIGPHAVVLRQTSQDVYYLRLGTHTPSFEAEGNKQPNDILSATQLDLDLHTRLTDFFYLTTGRGFLGHFSSVLAPLQSKITVSKPLNSSPIDEQQLQLKYDYSQGIPNASLYRAWSSIDPLFNSLSSHIPGMRILRQDPLETLFSFIFSSNNNISRITGSLTKL